MKNKVVLFCVFFVFVSIAIFAEWVLIDSTSFSKLLPTGEKCYITLQASTNFLISILPPDNLTDDAEAAVDIAPNWLKMDLRDNFSRLDENAQNQYAALIINASYPFVDEFCFQIAHIAPHTLNSTMDINVLTENVYSLYANSYSLDYVDIVDYNGDDYYSTTVYQVEEEGVIQEYELPRDIYYWYIVHPKLHKEVPNYIDPDTGTAANPPTGVFWRQFLMNHSDPGYTALSTYLDTCNVLWKCEQNTIDNGAVGAVTQWVQDVMTFQSNPHHNQPVRIYRQHLGTCSVHAYLTSAVARAALIPATVNVMYSDNHKINEFYKRRWIAWEPVNTFIDNPGVYENWGWDLASAFNWRGDGYIWDTTEEYTEVCTLSVNVTDNNGNPVDGARIKIYSSPCVSWGCTSGWTDFNGQKQFLLGDSRTFTAQVTSSIGNYPASGMETVIANSGSGIYYNWNVTLPGTMPALDISPDSPPANPTDDYQFVIEYEVLNEILHGVNIDDNNEFSNSTTPGHIDFFICDEDNFNEYMSAQSFEAFEINQNSPANTIDFVLPSSDSWCAVFSNEEKLSTTQELQASIKLYQNVTGITPEEEISELYPGITLYQNYPNPFNPETTISYSLLKSSKVSLKIYNIKGQLVETLVNEVQQPGHYSIVWNAEDISSGIYFYRITSGDFTDTNKCVILK